MEVAGTEVADSCFTDAPGRLSVEWHRAGPGIMPRREAADTDFKGCDDGAAVLAADDDSQKVLIKVLVVVIESDWWIFIDGVSVQLLGPEAGGML